ncbi:Fe-S-containing protein [Anaerosolibacter sp.]|uniref:Fe-S-containing protein n=1 Tax=Anaerosolibacter sp. TaxID=1872527 RepID=UPI0039EE1535
MKNKKKDSKKTFPIFAVVVVLMGAWYVFSGLAADKPADVGNNVEVPVTTEGDLVINKSEVSDKVSFYGYKDGDTYMEVLAVKATDGTVRTALNTCQVCFDSGRGYYVQQGDTVVCQNCGNVFKIDDIQKIKGGCNPVPIMEDEKTEDAESITIAQSYLSENKIFFSNWSKE